MGGGGGGGQIWWFQVLLIPPGTQLWGTQYMCYIFLYWKSHNKKIWRNQDKIVQWTCRYKYVHVHVYTYANAIIINCFRSSPDLQCAPIDHTHVQMFKLISKKDDCPAFSRNFQITNLYVYFSLNMKRKKNIS